MKRNVWIVLLAILSLVLLIGIVGVVVGSGEKENEIIIKKTSDGEYLIVGRISHSANDFSSILLTKTDANGTEKWNKTYEMSGHHNHVKSVQQTIDGGYLVVGYKTDHGDYIGFYTNAFLVKIDKNGTKKWEKTLKGYKGTNNYRILTIQTFDKGYVILGQANYNDIDNDDLWMVKIDTNGTEEWEKRFRANGYDWSIEQSLNDEYILAGEKHTAGYYSVWLIKTDENGTEVWSKIFNEPRISASLLPAPTSRTPGFESIFAIAGIAIVYLRTRKGENLRR